MGFESSQWLSITRRRRLLGQALSPASDVFNPPHSSIAGVSAGQRRKRSFIATSIASRPRPSSAECARFTDANWMPKWTSLPPQSNDGDCARTRRSALGALYRNKYGDRHLREQGSRCASEQKFPQPRVTIGSKYEQVRSALHGRRDDHLRDRRAVRHHAFHVEMHTMPRQLQGDVGTGLVAVSAASGRIHD